MKKTVLVFIVLFFSNLVHCGENENWVEMFDGETLNGWTSTPRLYVPRKGNFKSVPSNKLYEVVTKYYQKSPGKTNGTLDRERVKNKGVWSINDGVVIGEQVPGTIAGAYLMSEKKYGDFEMVFEANPDYPVDTGVMIRAHKLGTIGFQVLVDMRPNGTVGGIYGNSVGHFFAYPFVFKADELKGFKISNIREGDPNAIKFRGGQFKTDYAATLNDFKEVWKTNEWNEIKIRCTGEMPLIETWINGTPIAKLDTSKLINRVPNFNPEEILGLIGREGHIGFEVHDSPKRDRWAPGAACRWRNVRIKELNQK